MSIICYTGLPGDGKSYSAVENVVIPALKQGRVVAHNLMLNEAALRVVTDRDVSKLLVQLDRDATPTEIVEACPPGAVIVLDEVWRYWPAGVKANEVPKDELKFFKEHRHRVGDDGIASEILIIDQDPKTGVPAFLRALIELTYVHTKHSKVGASGRFRVDVYNRCQAADKPAKGALIRKLQGRYVPEVWNCYISHTQSKRLGEAGLEKVVDDRGNLLKSWTVKLAIVAALFLPFAGYGAWRSVNNMVSHGGTKQNAARVYHGHVLEPVREDGSGEAAKPLSVAYTASAPGNQTGQAAAAALSASRQTAVDLLPAISGKWRVLGGIVRKDGSGTVILTSATGRRRIDAKLCTLDDRGEWRCTVEDGDATMWSGAKSSSPLSAEQAPGVGQDAPPLPGSPQAQGT